MYDIIKCKMYLEDDPKVLFQTKDLKCMMYYYTIRQDGRLVKHHILHHIIPEHKRPFYNTKQWFTNSKFKSIGSLKQEHVKNTFVDYEGILTFYVLLKDYIEYKAEFRDNVCQQITKVERKITPPWGLKGGEHLGTNIYTS